MAILKKVFFIFLFILFNSSLAMAGLSEGFEVGRKAGNRFSGIENALNRFVAEQQERGRTERLYEYERQLMALQHQQNLELMEKQYQSQIGSAPQAYEATVADWQRKRQIVVWEIWNEYPEIRKVDQLFAEGNRVAAEKAFAESLIYQKLNQTLIRFPGLLQLPDGPLIALQIAESEIQRDSPKDLKEDNGRAINNVNEELFDENVLEVLQKLPAPIKTRNRSHSLKLYHKCR